MKTQKLGLIFFVLLWGCGKQQTPSPPPRPALVMKAGSRATAGNASLAGEVRSRYVSSQSFRIGGKIIERKADIGDYVKKGQILAQLDPADTDLNVSAAQSDIRSAEANRALAATELVRYRQLSARKFVSASALDIKEAELKTADARLSQIKAQADITANQARYAYLKADRNGVVTSIQAEPGQVVGSGETVAQIADIKNLEVLIAVPESLMTHVKKDAAVTLKLWANPEKIYSGQVREISPSADSSTRTFNVRVSIHEPDETVKLGMTARVKFKNDDGPQDSGLLIPSAALTELNGKPSVWVIDSDNKAQPRQVEAGQFGEEGVLITGGLQAGELIAVAGVHTLIKDQPVKPVMETSP